MKIFGLVIMSQKSYNDEHKEHAKMIDVCEERCKTREDTLKKDKKELEKKCTEYITQIEKLTNSNISYKSANTKLSNENRTLKAELKNSYKLKKIPADKTKPKQISKVKSSSRTSRIARMMSL